MTRPSGSGVAACLVLVALLVVCAVIASPLLVIAVGPVMAGLLATELDRSGGLIATRIVRLAARVLPPQQRRVSADEWADHVLCAGGEGLRPVLVALTIALLAAPRMALRLWVRSAVGRYVLSIVAVVFTIKPPKPSRLSWVRSMIRVMTLAGLPLIALIELMTRRPLRTWLRGGIGYAAVWGLTVLASSLGFWLQALLVEATLFAGLGIAALVIQKLEPILQMALRLVGVLEGDAVGQATHNIAEALRARDFKTLRDD